MRRSTVLHFHSVSIPWLMVLKHGHLVQLDVVEVELVFVEETDVGGEGEVDDHRDPLRLRRTRHARRHVVQQGVLPACD
jgi:hypothetical protein